MNVARVAAACAVLLLTARAAHGQVGADPGSQASSPSPNRGLYGSGVTASHSLTANATIGAAAYQTFGLPAATGSFRSRRQSWVGQLTGSLNYSLALRRLGISARAGSAGVYYPELAGATDPFVQTRNAGLDLSFRLGRQTSISGSHAIGYQPVYFLTTLAGIADPASEVATIVNGKNGGELTDNYLRRATTATLSHRFSRRVDGQLGATYTTSNSDSKLVASDALTGGGRLNVGLTQRLSLRVGYQYQDANYDENPVDSESRLRGHSVDVGLDYGRAISLSRHTTLTFGTGGTFLVDRFHTRRYVVTGRALLAHQIGRTWSATAGFARSAQLSEAFRDPVVSDTATGTLSGLLSRRLQFFSSVAGSVNTVGFTGGANGFGQVQASAGIVTAISRHAGVGVSYGYFYRSFERDVSLVSGLPARSNSQSVQVYLTLWSPIFQSGRRSSASR